MGIVLRPKTRTPALTAEQLLRKLRGAGFRVRANRVAAKKSIIEQIVLTYGPCLTDGKKFEPSQFDWLCNGYADACEMSISESSVDETIELLFTTGERIWFGECFPTRKDAKSKLVMRIAKLLQYDAEGE